MQRLEEQLRIVSGEGDMEVTSQLIQSGVHVDATDAVSLFDLFFFFLIIHAISRAVVLCLGYLLDRATFLSQRYRFTQL